ncbi:PIR protein [Plasmodium yoelii]|uniref:PIR protein n=2 Tax=Plasmodium yoelii TaxID=5861 RepID=A0AAE9WUT8_PLAYO|nr:PIR protein [Plasmodium yoelii]WBY59000.1 PIR protein [Plasmodium yoelii yoelii]CDU19194.1 YIR protein [Plasmodium yoelii]VTZ79829.1 PIR protein [Plasmodium yoelii]|eukprot:XP_022812546.1 PIR protein [Plasmodium yoelii]
MNDKMCYKFFAVRNSFPDQLSKGNYQFNNNFKNTFCTDIKCETDIDKMNAVFLWLFDAIFGDSYSYTNYAKGNINIVGYILAWLSYKLNQKSHDKINNLNEFYDQYINNDKEYIKDINNVSDYKSYKDLIDKKQELMSIDIKDISKFYDPFKLLCEMYVEIDANISNCQKFLEKAKEFAKKYDDLNEDYNNTKGSPYNQILSTLSNDYNNLKNKCNSAQSINFPTLPTYSRRSVIKHTLISITFVFVAVSIFLGISYKYSLFGFRKRFQKQKLREKIKNIKKRMNQ